MMRTYTMILYLQRNKNTRKNLYVLQTSDASFRIQVCSPWPLNSRIDGGKQTERISIGEYWKKATILPNLSNDGEEKQIIVSPILQLNKTIQMISMFVNYDALAGISVSNMTRVRHADTQFFKEY